MYKRYEHTSVQWRISKELKWNDLCVGEAVQRNPWQTALHKCNLVKRGTIGLMWIDIMPAVGYGSWDKGWPLAELFSCNFCLEFSTLWILCLVQMLKILKWGKIVFKCVHNVLMLKILKGDEDCWSTKSNPDWRQTDLWYITKANRLPWLRTQLCSFPCLFIRIHSIFKEVIVFWWSISTRPNITHIHQSAKKRSESVRHAWLAFWEVSCNNAWLSDKWEVFLKECLRSVEVSESLFQSVEPEQSSECEVKSKSKKRWDCCEEVK